MKAVYRLLATINIALTNNPASMRARMVHAILMAIALRNGENGLLDRKIVNRNTILAKLLRQATATPFLIWKTPWITAAVRLIMPAVWHIALIIIMLQVIKPAPTSLLEIKYI